MTSHFTDERGLIADLFQAEGASVTYITFKKGSVRGNHYHEETKQIDFVIKGRFIVKTEWPHGAYRASNMEELNIGNIVQIPEGKAHAYLALEDSEMISVCIGKRVGTDYEKDTIRLKEPLL